MIDSCGGISRVASLFSFHTGHCSMLRNLFTYLRPYSTEVFYHSYKPYSYPEVLNNRILILLSLINGLIVYKMLLVFIACKDTFTGALRRIFPGIFQNLSSSYEVVPHSLPLP